MMRWCCVLKDTGAHDSMDSSSAKDAAQDDKIFFKSSPTPSSPLQRSVSSVTLDTSSPASNWARAFIESSVSDQ